MVGSYSARSRKTRTSTEDQTYLRYTVYKGVLDRETLISEGGVEYFKDTLRLHFIKGALSVFFWMCFQVIRARRENMEMVKWIEKNHNLSDTLPSLPPFFALRHCYLFQEAGKLES